MTPAPWWPAGSGIVGVALLAVILWDAFETILVPRRIGRRVRLTRYFYLVTWRVWRFAALGIPKLSRRESLLGFYGPLSLLVLLAFWAAGLIVGFALLQIAVDGPGGMRPDHFVQMLYMSGETFFTLGFGDITPASGVGRALAVLEAGMGFGFLGTVVGYLPTMYTSFAQREIEISLLDARAGSPPSAAEFLFRLPDTLDSELCAEAMRGWERWSAQLLETHISYPQLAYYRSQHSNQSWLAALTTILDSTALVLARDGSVSPRQAKLTFSMARHALVDVTQIFVRRYVPGAPARLDADTMARLRARLAETSARIPDGPEFEERLADLRLMYEPYAQALARYLLFELPPWVHGTPRRDNWRGGPWDRMLNARHEGSHRGDEHF